MAKELHVRTWRRVSERVTVALALSTLSLGCADFAAPTSAAAPTLDRSAVPSSMASRSEVIPGQYIVTFTQDESDVRGLANRLVAEQGGELGFTYTDAIKGFSAKLSDQAADALSRNPRIASIEPDQLVESSETQSGAIWNLDRLDQRTRTLDGTYSYATNGAGVNAYIMDSGIRLTHTEFEGRASGAYTAVNDGRGTDDCTGHGTHVAGTVGGLQYGVAKGVKLYAVRVFDCNGYAAWSGVLSAIDWVTRNRVLPAVVNMSIEGPKTSTVNTAVQSMIDAGIVVVVAAGNDAADACNYTPASAPAALTVGSSWNFDGMSGFSNFGSCVDLFAPGESIRSAYYKSDTASVLKGGTSMSAPHVAGVAALYLSLNPTATPSQVTDAILGNATANVLTSVPAGTANLLLYSSITSASATPSVDTTTTTSPPPTTDPAPVTDLPPVAAFSSTCGKSKCTFDGSASTDDFGIVGYSWSFGDASATASGATLQRVTHSYTRTGSYTVSLTVTDAAGQRSTKSTTVTIKKL